MAINPHTGIPQSTPDDPFGTHDFYNYFFLAKAAPTMLIGYVSSFKTFKFQVSRRSVQRFVSVPEIPTWGEEGGASTTLVRVTTLNHHFCNLPDG